MFRTPSAIVASVEHVRERFTGDQHLLQNYARAPIEIERGEGCEVIDTDGNRYLDMVSGIAVCALGHAHPAITEAITKQAGLLVQASNVFHTGPAGALADELSKLSGLERVFFCNSGTEANEAAIKLARKRAFRNGEPDRVTIVSCEGSFHGRTFGSLAATANAHYQEGFGPMPAGFVHVPFNDIAALEGAIDQTVAAFLVEPIQGESGVKPADRAYLEAARTLCDKHGALLIFDEIQCGLGRVGTMFAYQTYGVRPDAITLAKSLANGLPIGALLVDATAAGALQPGDHGTTFGGSPVPCAAALAGLRVRADSNLDANVAHVGPILRAGLEALHASYPTKFGPPRGMGFMLGLPVLAPYRAKTVVERARIDERLLLLTAGETTLRFVPALILTEAQAREAVDRLGRTAARLEIPASA